MLVVRSRATAIQVQYKYSSRPLSTLTCQVCIAATSQRAEEADQEAHCAHCTLCALCAFCLPASNDLWDRRRMSLGVLAGSAALHLPQQDQRQTWHAGGVLGGSIISTPPSPVLPISILCIASRYSHIEGPPIPCPLVLVLFLLSFLSFCGGRLRVGEDPSQSLRGEHRRFSLPKFFAGHEEV